MPTSETVAELQWIIESVLRVLTTKTDPSLSYGVNQLKILQHRLHALPPEQPPSVVELLELDFYSLLKSESKLKDAFFVVWDTEIVGILSNRLKYFVDLSKERSLTDDEQRQKRRVESELFRATNKMTAPGTDSI